MKKPLIVFIPGLSGNSKCFDELKLFLKKNTYLDDTFIVDFNYRKPFWSNADLDVISNDLANEIDNFFSTNKNEISKIILVGHSMGTTFLRRAFLNASGFGISNILAQPWIDKVSRIILMGAIGRGIIIDNFPKWERRGLKFGIALFNFFGIGKMRLSVINGADFISRLRIDWIKYNREISIQPKLIHLLGKQDRLVKPSDVIDLEQFPNAIPIGVPKVGHRLIIFPNEFTKTPLIRAFTETPESTREIELDTDAQKIYFFMHGIRDSRECFEKVARLLKEQNPDSKIIIPTYGFLSAKGFLSSNYRNSFIPWFVDQFAEYYARYPKATFYFAGHSNGTYILGEALKRIPSISFSRIYLAASVLPPNYQWDDVVEKNHQTDFIRSDMGTEDWPVSVLCRVLNKFGMKSIGPGGADGFEWEDDEYFSHNRFNGGHDAMLTLKNTPSIVSFLLNGTAVKDNNELLKSPSTMFIIFKKFGDVLIPLGLLCVTALLIYLFKIIIFPYKFLVLVVPILIWIFLDRF